MKYIAKFGNGYRGCEDFHFIIADNENQVASFMQEGIYDYAAKYEWIVRFHDDNIESDDEWYNSEEYENYLDDCYFDFWEATEEDIKNWHIKEDDWEDIT